MMRNFVNQQKAMMNFDTAPLCNFNNQAERKFASELILWITGKSLSGIENTYSFYEGFCKNLCMYEH